MIATVLATLFGFLFGYGLIGPIAVTYSARAYFPLILFVCLLMGFGVYMAGVIAGFLEGHFELSVPTLGGPWIGFAFGVATGTSIRVARRNNQRGALT